MSNIPGDSNPFSFKAFVKRNDIGEAESKVTLNSMSSSSDNEGFISDHDENPFSFKTFVTEEVTSLVPDQSEHISLFSVPETFSSDESLEANDCFIAEAEDKKTEKETIGDESIKIDLPISDQSSINVCDNSLSAELKKCQKENQILVKALHACEIKLQREKERNMSLQKRLIKQRKKELSETKALEEMVIKVEKNLAVANERSSVAESTIAVLQTKIHKLQNELATIKNPQAVHQSYQDVILSIKDKANYASQQLTVASQRADIQIRELCQGVETLKIVSEILANIDSAFEIKSVDDDNI